MCVCDLTEVLEISQPAVSQHMRRLRQAGFVNERRGGQWIYYSLNMGNPLICLLLPIKGKKWYEKKFTYKATVDELFHLDLAYAPPFSTTKDPVHYTGMILDNASSGGRKLITPNEMENMTENIQIIDVRSRDDFNKKGSADQAINISHANLREKLGELDKK